MRERLIAWVLRGGAWACVLLVIGRIAWQPRRVWITGRILQLNVRTDHRRAARALLRETGLDQHFDPGRDDLWPSMVQSPTVVPTFVGLVDQTRGPNDPPQERFVRVEPDGQMSLPPLENPTEMPLFDAVSVPECLDLHDHNGRQLPAGVMGRFSKVGKSEWMIWIHRSDRWVNALRLLCVSNLGELEPVPSAQRANAVEIRRCNARFLWDALEERFIIPPDLDARVQVLARIIHEGLFFTTSL